MHPLVKKTLELALAQRGTSEIIADGHGTNTGEKVSAWLRRAGVAPGNPWCCAFEFSMADDAANALGVANPLPKTAYCPNMLNWGRTWHLGKDTAATSLERSVPQVGFIFLRYGTVNGVRRVSHTGYVLAVDTIHQTFTEISGNTNSNGSREGTSVLVQPHSYASGQYTFLDWGLACEDVAPQNAPLTYTLLNTKGAAMAAVAPMPLINGRAFVDTAEFGAGLGFQTGFDNEAQGPVYNGNLIPVECSLLGTPAVPYASVRDLAESLVLDVAVDNDKRTVRLVRPTA